VACWSGSSPVGCISIRVAATLSVMSDNLSLQSSRSMFSVLLVDSRSYGYVKDYNISTIFTLPLALTSINVLLVMLVLVYRCKHNNWLN
jgi:hypothetical protein